MEGVDESQYLLPLKRYFEKKGWEVMKLNLPRTVSEGLRNILLEELLENPFLGINITDGEGRVLYLNAAHRQITGHDPKLYLGRTMKEVVEDKLISESATQIAIDTKRPVLINQVSSYKNKFFQVKSIPVKDQKGNIQYVVNYLLELSELIRLRNELQRASNHNKTLLSNNELLRQKLNRSGEIIYRSKKMEKIVEVATRVAECDVSVLITGPSGSGKEVIANLIHSHSRRNKAPFIKINCAAIPEQLLESELFGYEPGAFTGGNPKGKKGLIESAHTGTLLLDEIGELSLPLQSKLLRVLQTHNVRHIGSNKDIYVDFRLIASTNANLKERIADKIFREDLYYRLSVICITLPSLDERPEDIVPLINHFLDINNARYGAKKILRNDAIRFLSRCSYPGNARELRNVIERAVVMSSGDVISLSDAMFSYSASDSEFLASEIVSKQSDDFLNGGNLKEIMANYEKKVLQQYMNKYKSGAKVAEVLQTDQSTISRKCRKYHIISE